MIYDPEEESPTQQEIREVTRAGISHILEDIEPIAEELAEKSDTYEKIILMKWFDEEELRYFNQLTGKDALHLDGKIATAIMDKKGTGKDSQE